jgi:hypothetical protein
MIYLHIHRNKNINYPLNNYKIIENRKKKPCGDPKPASKENNKKTAAAPRKKSAPKAPHASFPNQPSPSSFTRLFPTVQTRIS